MKLSIITINLNNQAGLRRTIESVVSQTFKDFEWIVIDGGSTDGSKELLEQYANHIAYLVSEPDKGIYNAMNKGIRVANGEYIQFLNSGDWFWNRDSLADVFYLNPNTDIFYADCNLMDGDSVVERRRYPEIMSLKEILEFNICHNSTFFKRDLFNNDIYNENLYIAADFEFLLKKILENHSIAHLPTLLIGYDISGISGSNPDIINKEKKTIIKAYISPAIQKDLNAIDFLSEHKKDAVLEKIDYYRKHSRFYHKLITASLILMEKFSRNHIEL